MAIEMTAEQKAEKKATDIKNLKEEIGKIQAGMKNSGFDVLIFEGIYDSNNPNPHVEFKRDLHNNKITSAYIYSSR